MRASLRSTRSITAVLAVVIGVLLGAPGAVVATGSSATAAPAGPGQHADRSVDLATGYAHSCALLAVGTVKCWGSNADGALGDGTTTDRHAPVTVRASSGTTSALSGVSAIAAGDMHTCALLAVGTVRCWGFNGDSELGDGTSIDRTAPVTVRASAGSSSPLSGVTAIAAGDGHTCALLAGGTVKCWGFGGFGQLGDGTTNSRSAPVTVRASSGTTSALSGVSAIVAEGFHTCALLVAGTVTCWGENGAGQLGDGTTTERHAPVAVHASSVSASALVGVKAIAAGHAHTCALVVDGTVRCWGANGADALGDGTSTERHAPVTVKASAGSAAALTGVSAITGGGFHMCALLAAGTIKCWGFNLDGQLGDGTTTSRSAPVTVKVASGSTSALPNVTAISGGTNHTCALLSTGSVRCWGWGSLGELGDGTTTSRLAPVTVRAAAGSTSALVGVGQRAITAGFGQTCALLVAGTVKCWGANFLGEVGDGTTSQRSAPVTVRAGWGSGALSNVVAIAAGGFYTCALLATGTVRCWGTDYDLVPVDVMSGPGSSTPLSNVIALAAGAHHTCALLVGGTLKCWGDNTFGQIGDNTKTARPAPVTVRSAPGSSTSLSAVRAVSAGQFHTCALVAAGTMKCWGLNAAVNDPFGIWSSGGQLGDGTATNRAAPVTVKSAAGSTTALSGVTAIASGGLHSCALLVAGTMKCWGDNTTFGQVGDGTVIARRAPVAVRASATSSSSLSGVGAIAAGQWSSCAILAAGTVTCWGDNTFGQLGDGTTTDRHAPVTVHASPGSASALSGVSAIASMVYGGQDGGGDHACALLASGMVKCWGDNAYGAVGDGTTAERHAPVTVINLP